MVVAYARWWDTRTRLLTWNAKRRLTLRRLRPWYALFEGWQWLYDIVLIFLRPPLKCTMQKLLQWQFKVTNSVLCGRWCAIWPRQCSSHALFCPQLIVSHSHKTLWIYCHAFLGHKSLQSPFRSKQLFVNSVSLVTLMTSCDSLQSRSVTRSLDVIGMSSAAVTWAFLAIHKSVAWHRGFSDNKPTHLSVTEKSENEVVKKLIRPYKAGSFFSLQLNHSEENYFFFNFLLSICEIMTHKPSKIEILWSISNYIHIDAREVAWSFFKLSGLFCSGSRTHSWFSQDVVKGQPILEWIVLVHGCLSPEQVSPANVQRGQLLHVRVGEFKVPQPIVLLNAWGCDRLANCSASHL